jgi:hypothetical protein
MKATREHQRHPSIPRPSVRPPALGTAFHACFLTVVLEAQLTNFQGNEDLTNPRNHGGICTLLANCDQGQELAGLLALKTVLEASEHFKAAAPIKALDIELAATIEAETEKERQRHHFAQELADIEDSTRAKLAAQAAQDPAEIEARKRLEAAHKLSGKGSLVIHPPAVLHWAAGFSFLKPIQ